jgi:hypothetical protein
VVRAEPRLTALFDRLLDPEQGGRFSAMSKESFTVERRSEIMRF